MAERTVIPFGPNHPVLPEPVQLDLVMDGDRVAEVVPHVGYIHRGLEKLVEKREYPYYVYVTERICGICSFGHSMGYCETIEDLMGVEVPPRALGLRVMWHELSRVHSHLLWLGLLADAFDFEKHFLSCWGLRERVLDIFESTLGSRVIHSGCKVGGVNYDIENGDLRGIVSTLEELLDEYKVLLKAFLEDTSVVSRLSGMGVLTKKEAEDYGVVGPTARASGVASDVRLFGHGGYGFLDGFEPVVSDEGDGYARCTVRAREVVQSIGIIREIVDKMPEGDISVEVAGSPAAGSRAVMRLEQPRGEVFYYAKGNGTRFLDRFRIRTPTFMNLGGMVQILKGCTLADVPLNILTIDPCISCAER